MPRVSDEHLEARRTQIIDAAVRCFARQGFHATSMQDVFAESGLSAGAVYRYFPSKSALVSATSEFVMRQLSGVLLEMEESGPLNSPADLVHAATNKAATITLGGGVPISRLALNAWSEALRDDDVAVVVRGIIAEVRALLTPIIRRWQDEGRMATTAGPEEIAAPMYSLLVGYLMQSSLTDGLDPVTYTRAVEALSGAGTEIPGGNA